MGNMSNKKRGSSGGKARAIIQKEEAKLRIDEYNKNPNLCLCCGNPILAPYDKKLRETIIKKFCSKSCAAKYNNRGNIKNFNGTNNITSKIDNLTDDEILEAFNKSNNITEFSKNLGYKSKIQCSNISINNRLKNLGLSLEDLKKNSIEILKETKESLSEKYSHQTAWRSTIQKHARQTYENSNKPKYCIVCGYDIHYEVAHIKAVSDFDNDVLISEINNIDNLTALCPNHHWEYDNGMIDISTYIN